MYHFHTIHHHFLKPQNGAFFHAVCTKLIPTAAHISLSRLKKICRAKDPPVSWQISKTTMDLFTFRPSFTLDFCSHFELFRTSRLQSAKSTCTRLDESPGDEDSSNQPAVNHNVSNGQQFQTEPQSIRKIAVVNTCGRLVYQLNLSLYTPKQQSPG